MSSSRVSSSNVDNARKRVNGRRRSATVIGRDDAPSQNIIGGRLAEDDSKLPIKWTYNALTMITFLIYDYLMFSILRTLLYYYDVD